MLQFSFTFIPHTHLYSVSVEGFWLGATTLAQAGVWQWETGSCGEWSFANWGGYYGGGVSQRCLTVGDVWNWNDYNCDGGNGFICEFSL